MLLSSQNFHNNKELARIVDISVNEDGKNVIDKMHQVGSQYRNKPIQQSDMESMNLSKEL